MTVQHDGCLARLPISTAFSEILPSLSFTIYCHYTPLHHTCPSPNPLPHSHQRLPQKIHPPLLSPPLRLRRPKPHPPHPIPRTRLHQLPLARLHQPLPQPPLSVLKLQPTPLHHNLELDPLPLLPFLLPPLHLPAQGFLLPRLTRGEDRVSGCGVGAEERLVVHPALLGAVVRGVGSRVVEGGEEPLREEAIWGFIFAVEENWRRVVGAEGRC